MDGTYQATIDRIVDGETAVILLESDGEVIEQFDVPVDRLPDACAAGSVVRVTVRDDELVDIVTRPEETAERNARLDEKFDRLSKRLGEDDDHEE